jgi:phosphohistidine phosphatase
VAARTGYGGIAVRVTLLRHAKSSWDYPTLPDEARPLAARGRKAAERMRGHLELEPVGAELVLCSSATRARETLAIVLPALGAPLQIEVDPDLYTFDDEVVLDRLRGLRASVSSVLVIGHNPAFQALAMRLADRGEDLPALAAKFPTCALAEIELPAASWSEVPDPPGELLRFVTPRAIA